MASVETLLEPVQIGSLAINNRMIMAPLVTNFCHADGSVSDRYLAFLQARARAGVGLLITEATSVHSSGKAFPNGLGIHSDAMLPGLQRLTDAVHAAGAKIAVQLFHGGRQCFESITGQPLLAPSAIPCPFCGGQPRAMTGEDMQRIIAAFGEAALRAQKAGFDAVEVHGAHGYLLCEFLSAYSNQRSDEYGGSLENRARFPLAVVKKVREAVGADFPVLYRLSAEEYVPGGLTLAETEPFCRMLVAAGIDALDISGGVYESADKVIQGLELPQGVFVANAAAIKRAVSGQVPVIVAGRLNDPPFMADIVATGKVDLVAIGRGLLADAELVRKIETGHFDDIRNCTACKTGCVGRLFSGKDIACPVNPSLGHESES
ncbi:MAG: NADH:flavin oxidoreductase [Desulfuromonadaceae bacterium]